MLGVLRSPTEEIGDLDIAHLPARRSVRLVPDENAFDCRIARDKPTVAIWAAIEFSRVRCHLIHSAGDRINYQQRLRVFAGTLPLASQTGSFWRLREHREICGAMFENSVAT